jgi:hypothetical protein
MAHQSSLEKSFTAQVAATISARGTTRPYNAIGFSPFSKAFDFPMIAMGMKTKQRINPISAHKA